MTAALRYVYSSVNGSGPRCAMRRRPIFATGASTVFRMPLQGSDLFALANRVDSARRSHTALRTNAALFMGLAFDWQSPDMTIDCRTEDSIPAVAVFLLAPVLKLVVDHPRCARVVLRLIRQLATSIGSVLTGRSTIHCVGAANTT